MKPTCQKIARSGIWLWLALCLCVRTAAAQGPTPLLVVEVSEADQLAARRLLALTEQPAQLVRMPEARDPARALDLARSAGARQVVIFDQVAARVVVLRSADGASWVRSTEASSTTPFEAAFVAVELLSLGSVPQRAAVETAPAVDAWGLRTLTLRVGFDALLRDPYAGSLRARLGLLAAFARASSPLALLLELSLAPHAQQDHALGMGRLSLSRTDLTARAGALWQRARLGLACFADAGVLLTDAAYHGSTPREEHRRGLLLGVGAEPSVLLWPWLRLYGSARLDGATSRGDYRFGGQSALREPRLGVQLGAGLVVTLPFKHD